MRFGRYIGAMTGTSMDGIDVVLLNVSEEGLKTCGHISRDIPEPLRNTLLSLCTPGANEIQRAGEANVQLGREIAAAINSLLEEQGLEASEIQACGSHGQTIRHSVDTPFPFSLQIGDPSTIAEQTGITTVADFRMADIASGGQGAPLAPAFHEAVFASDEEHRAIINLGGIANITTLIPGQPTLGYDTGPANTLMDQWIQKCKGEAFDKSGAWAKNGQVMEQLLESMLNDAYFQLAPPKSTGRELFNLNWLEGHLKELPDYEEVDIQRTLLELSVVSIASEVKQQLPKSARIYLCGGGVENKFLIERLQERLPDYDINDTGALGIHPQQIEAAAFAWLAHRTISRLHGNLPSVTGSKKLKILGAIYTSS